MIRPTRAALFERRREMANLAHRIVARQILGKWGWLQPAIAELLQIPQGTASRDLAARRELWRELRRKFSGLRSRERALRAGAACGISTAVQGNFAKSRGVSPSVNYARNCHFNAHQGPLCASARIIVELCVSHYSAIAFSDFSANARPDRGFEKHTRRTTQVIARQSEAATAHGSRIVAGVGNYAHKRIYAVVDGLMGKVRQCGRLINPPHGTETGRTRNDLNSFPPSEFFPPFRPTLPPFRISGPPRGRARPCITQWKTLCCTDNQSSQASPRLFPARPAMRRLRPVADAACVDADASSVGHECLVPSRERYIFELSHTTARQAGSLRLRASFGNSARCFCKTQAVGRYPQTRRNR
jgi:hypothetical protein